MIGNKCVFVAQGPMNNWLLKLVSGNKTSDIFQPKSSFTETSEVIGFISILCSYFNVWGE